MFGEAGPGAPRCLRRRMKLQRRHERLRRPHRHREPRYAAAILRLGQREVDRALDEVLSLAAHAYEQSISTLSRRRRSRVSLAVALLGHPDLLVLDEPTVGIDYVLRRDLWDLFRRLRDAEADLLVSSHVMDETVRAATVLVAMREGGDVLAGRATLPVLARTGARGRTGPFLSSSTAAKTRHVVAGQPRPWPVPDGTRAEQDAGRRQTPARSRREPPA